MGRGLWASVLALPFFRPLNLFFLLPFLFFLLRGCVLTRIRYEVGGHQGARLTSAASFASFSLRSRFFSFFSAFFSSFDNFTFFTCSPSLPSSPSISTSSSFRFLLFFFFFVGSASMRGSTGSGASSISWSSWSSSCSRESWSSTLRIASAFFPGAIPFWKNNSRSSTCSRNASPNLGVGVSTKASGQMTGMREKRCEYRRSSRCVRQWSICWRGNVRCVLCVQDPHGR